MSWDSDYCRTIMQTIFNHNGSCIYLYIICNFYPSNYFCAKTIIYIIQILRTLNNNLPYCGNVLPSSNNT